MQSIKEENVTKEEIKESISKLNQEGFIDLKYFDDEVFVVRPLLKSFLSGEERRDKQEKIPDNQLIALFLLCFTGAFMGGLLICLAAVILC